MKKKLNVLFTFACLIATSVVTIATSKGQRNDSDNLLLVSPESLARKDYYVASNCPQSIPQERVTIENELIQYPTNRSFLDYGLPANSLNITHTTSFAMDIGGGRVRDCVRSELPGARASLTVYTCKENGMFLCQVTFEAVQ